MTRAPSLPTISFVTRPSRSPQRAAPAERVIDLGRERARLRVRAWRTRVQGMLAENKRTLGKLFSTGTLFTRQGARAGRDLLAAYQDLLKMSDLLAQLSELGSENGDLGGREARALFEQLEILVVRSSALASRTDGLLASLMGR